MFPLPALIGLLLFWLLPLAPRLTETFFSRFLFRVVSVPLGALAAVFPLSLTECLVILALPLFILLLILWIRRLKRSADRCRLLGRSGRALGWVLSSVFLRYMLMHGAKFYRLPVSQLMDIDTAVRTPAFLQQVCIDLAKKASAERLLVQEDEEGCMKLSQSKANTLRLAQDGYQKLSDDLPFLWGGVWRAKPVLLSHWWSYTGITGMYFPFFAEANVNVDIPDWDIPSTAAHELAHTRGFAREDECNFFAYLTSIASDSADFRYSGYLLAYIYCSNALYGYDGEMGAEARSYCSEGVQRDLAASSRYWKQFEGKVQEVSTSVNNSFIASQGDDDGVLSYGRVVQLIVGYYDQQDWIANT